VFYRPLGNEYLFASCVVVRLILDIVMRFVVYDVGILSSISKDIDLFVRSDNISSLCTRYGLYMVAKCRSSCRGKMQVT